MKIPASLMTYVVDPLDRAARTFLQQFVAILTLGGSGALLAHQSWAPALDSAAFAAAVTVITTYATLKLTINNPLLDHLVRVGKTFLQSMGGTLAASQVFSLTHADWKGAIAVAIPVAISAFATGKASFLPAGFGAAKAVAGQEEVDPALVAAPGAHRAA